MRQSLLLAAAVIGALSAPGASRHFKLEGEPAPGTKRVLSAFPVKLADGQTTSWETVTKTGKFWDPRYGDFEISREMLLSIVGNFDSGVYGQDILIDRAHKPSEGTLGKIMKLQVDGNRLRALIDWTPLGVRTLQEWKYVYFSAEFGDNFVDNEKKQEHGPTLFGAGITPRPVIKGLDRIKGPANLQLSEDSGVPTFIHPELKTKLFQETEAMWKELIKKLTEALKLHKLADAMAAKLITLAEAAVGNTTDETVAKALIASFEDAGKQLAEQIAAGGAGSDIKIQLAVPDSFKAGMSKDDVEKLVKQLAEDNANAAKKLQETKAGKVKLLTDTINEAKGLDDETKKSLADAVSDLVGDMSDDQVKKLAAVQVESGNRQATARQLAGLGYTVQGSTIISVDQSNSVKALQDVVDKRLKIVGMPDSERYKRTGGTLPAANKKLADEVLAMFDLEHGRRLHTEHKALASGDSLVSDVNVPAIFERTVIREALYGLIGLQFVDVGTAPFSATMQLPYSYRDTGGAGINDTRTYEGGGIKRAGVKQAMEEARPLPQKLAFEVSDELRYLTGNGQIQWDTVIENTRNASRIIGEDTERLIFNEVLNACDQYAPTAVATEAVATADGTKTIFALDHFPVVRPKKIYDLQGNQVGSTLYPIVIKTNSVARAEYDGTNTQGAGLYYTMDFNLGEIHFVSELGVATAPTNTHAVEATSYNYATNVYAFDTDEGTDETDVHWNGFLYRYGLRKSVIEDARYYMANFGLMSGTVMTSIEQAKQFSANFGRPGTDLSTDGNLGRIKGVPNFKTTAPGLNMGDQRVVLGERSQTRMRMMKPWTMGQLQDQRDSNGRFVGKKEAYGDQFIVVHTPTQLKAATTSIVLYSSSARIDR